MGSGDENAETLATLASYANILLARHEILRDEPKECLRRRLLLRRLPIYRFRPGTYVGYTLQRVTMNIFMDLRKRTREAAKYLRKA